MHKKPKFELGATVYQKGHSIPHKINRIEITKDGNTYGVDFGEYTFAEDELDVKPVYFERTMLHSAGYYYISSDNLLLLMSDNTKQGGRRHYKSYNYFSHRQEAMYVKEHMMSDLLRAIWQWKYWNAPEEGSWGIAKIIEDNFSAPIDVHYFGERFEAPYIPTFKTPEAVEECLAYLRKEELIK